MKYRTEQNRIDTDPTEQIGDILAYKAEVIFEATRKTLQLTCLDGLAGS